MSDISPAPTYADPILIDEVTEKPRFNPIWLKWFLDLAEILNAAGGTTIGSVTSVAESFTGGLISVGGSPITTSGTLALTVAGTSGGVPYFSGATTWASSGALTQHGVVLGGGAGAAPTSLGVASANTFLAGVAASDPIFRTITLASADFANQGTTTTVLHGNAAGNPSFGAVALTADVTGTLPFGNGGTGGTAYTAGSVLFSNGTAIAQDNTNFFWDDTNNRLTIGAFDGAVPAPIQIKTDASGSGFNLVSNTTSTDFIRLVIGGAQKGFIGGGSGIPFVLQADGVIRILADGIHQWEFNNANGMFPAVDASYDIGKNATARVRSIFLSANCVAGGKVIVGGTSTTVTIGNNNAIQAQGTTAATNSLGISAWSADALGSRIELGKSRGAAIGTNTIVVSGDVLGSVTAYGANGTTFDPAAAIIFKSGGTPGASADMPGQIEFQVCPDGSATLATALTIASTKNATFEAAVAAAGTISKTDANGQSFGVKTLTELTTIAAAANTDTTIQMPAASIVLSVSVRVTVAVTCTSTFDVGDAGSATRFSTAAVSKAVNSTDAGTKAGAYYNASAASVRITPDTVPSDNTGRVRVTIAYIEVTPPTS